MPDSGTGRDDISFEAEKSFVRAPLNSRVVSSGGPRDKGKGKAKASDLEESGAGWKIIAEWNVHLDTLEPLPDEVSDSSL